MGKHLLKNKFISLIMATLTFIITCFSFAGCFKNNDADTDETNTAIVKEYNSFVQDLSKFPISFTYGDRSFNGFDLDYFTELSRQTFYERNGTLTVIYLQLGQILVTVETCLYKDYNAYDYTVYFKNVGQIDSLVLKNINVYTSVEGKNPLLKGILGDKECNYLPYEYNLNNNNAGFKSTSGRPTHVYFPYFNIENDAGGAMLALGWSGTWSADFTYDNVKNTTTFKGEGTVGLSTYLKPNETIRTPLVAVVRYYSRNEDLATNAWRKWMVDCNIPREGDTQKPMDPIRFVQISNDTGKPNSDGSISESYDTWQKSLESYYSHGLTADYRWFDAGWYVAPDGSSPTSDWYGTVGTWTIDPIKWPDDTFKQSVDYAKQHGTGTMVWFEPERVTNLDALSQNYGYNPNWAISSGKDYINNLGNEDALNWTINRVLSFMSTHGVSMYREDFNINPAQAWATNDLAQGSNRTGITENLYVQGHYKLWDTIIAWQKVNGGATCVDSCASGGGRNDLETMRRAIANLRSDSDRTTITRRLAMTSTLSKWLPFSGTTSSESSTELGNGIIDIYTMRASLLPTTVLNIKWYYDADNGAIDWDVLRQGEREWKEGSKYLLKDFYTLTPYRGVYGNDNWTAWEYYDADTDSALVQAFRQEEDDFSTYTIQIKGIDSNKYYNVRDLDGVNSISKVLGSTLKNGLTLTATNPRTAITLYIEPIA